MIFRSDNDANKITFVNGILRRANQDKNLEDEYEKEIEEDTVYIHKGI